MAMRRALWSRTIHSGSGIATAASSAWSGVPRLEGPLLDIGGGNGYVAKALEQAGIRCALVEPGIDGALAAHSGASIR